METNRIHIFSAASLLDQNDNFKENFYCLVLFSEEGKDRGARVLAEEKNFLRVLETI